MEIRPLDNISNNIPEKTIQDFSIGGFGIRLELPCRRERVSFGRTFLKFSSVLSKEPDILIRVQYGKAPKINLTRKNFLAGVDKWWEFYRSGKDKVFLLYPVKKKKRYFSISYKKVMQAGGRSINIKFKRAHDFKSINAILPLPRRTAVFDNDFKKGVIYVDCPGGSPLPNPLEYPLLDLMLVELLALSGGIKFHGSGVVDGGECYLFLGLPGKGKSTISDLWRREALLLNDDRVPVRKKGKSFFAFATPGNTTVTPRSAKRGFPVNSIFFLQHGKTNRLRRLNLYGALSMFVKSCPIATWDVSVLKQTIVLFTQMIKNLPCYSLHFVPDRRVLKFIREALER
ncbi:MAG: hypothetical protein PHQ84_06410 [Candidatus Omnitrophica bacterium]|nr:hypothetical protein [Candidatus Omnitrophota bacterium]MDD3275051.1 hypothetical protein [Candidatus Omnitrophota bacterium]MDD5078619.1 hypothetical protein [Candidatus Omnitrophota bacterium]MDD5725596.1 hypothetical protein [Candidatus Omnitrophota bacterium]